MERDTPFGHVTLTMDLNQCTGLELADLLPDTSEMHPHLGVRWQPCHGSQKFGLTIELNNVSDPLACLRQQRALVELGKSLLSWVKTRLLALLRQKGRLSGALVLKLKSREIAVQIEDPEQLCSYLENFKELVLQFYAKAFGAMAQKPLRGPAHC